MVTMTFEKIVEKTKKILGKNYRKPEPDGDMTDLEDICEMVIREAAQWTNRHIDRTADVDALVSMMNDCWPVIIKCSCIAYLNRGAEGLVSQSELGQQNAYNDWVILLHKQLMNRRHIM